MYARWSTFWTIHSVHCTLATMNDALRISWFFSWWVQLFARLLFAPESIYVSKEDSRELGTKLSLEISTKGSSLCARNVILTYNTWEVVSKLGQCLNLRKRNFLIYDIIKKNQKGDREMKMGILNCLKSILSFRPKGIVFPG